MADVKISELNGATTPLSGTEVVPLVQNGETKKVAVSEIGGGANPTSGVIPVNQNGSLVDSDLIDTSTKFSATKSSSIGFDGGVLVSNDKFAIGTNDFLLPISPQFHWGFSMDLSTFEIFNSFGKAEGNGFYAQYTNRATIGIGGNPNSVIGANSNSQMFIGSALTESVSAGLGTPVKIINVVDENGVAYKIPLYV